MLSPAEAQSLRPLVVGRFRLYLTPGTFLRRQTQYLDGTTFTLEPAGKYASLGAALIDRQNELAKNQYAPVVGNVHWDYESGALLYVKDVSDPDYLEIEGRRWLAGPMLVAVTSGDKKLVADMENNIRRMLASYTPGDASAGADNIFGIPGGTLHLRYLNNEEVNSYLTVPEFGSKLDFTAAVVAKPDPVHLWDRAEAGIGAAKHDGLAIETIRKGKATAAGQEGQEFVSSAVEHGVRQFEARFETEGAGDSPTKAKLTIHLQTDPLVGAAPTQEHFLAFWDTFLSTLRTN